MKALLLSMVLMAAHAGAPAQRPVDDYVVGPRDVLSVAVFGVEQLTRGAIIVDADGTFDFPHIGRVAAGGKTVRQIEDEIAARLKKGELLVNPQVTVTVTAFRSQSVHVVGEVQSPQQVTLAGNASIMAALAAAGSLTSTAASYVLVNRSSRSKSTTGPVTGGDGDTFEQFRFTRKELETGQANRFRLLDGDTIVVPKAETVFVTGQVRTPGPVVLEDGMTVLKAVSLAGGPTERGAMSRAKIRRVVNGHPIELRAKENDLVKADDIITIPQRIW